MGARLCRRQTRGAEEGPVWPAAARAGCVPSCESYLRAAARPAGRPLGGDNKVTLGEPGPSRDQLQVGAGGPGPET